MSPRLRRACIAVAATLTTAPLGAQSWSVRFDASAQRVSFRGLLADSVHQSQVVTGPSGGPESPDGFAVTCFADEYCRFYRAGPVRRGLPASAGTDLTLWGLGLQGLRIRLNARTLTDLTGDRLWPGSSPSLRVIEGYAEYLRGAFTARLGRTLEPGRLGGFGAGGLDGLRASYRLERLGLELGGYLGWGLARGTVLPVTSPAVNPLAEFQPSHRQVVAGARAGFRRGTLDAEVEYRREVDPRSDYFVSERAAFSLNAQPASFIRLTGGADYDVAQGHWGSAEATLAYAARSVWVTAGVRRYRPFFDLWTVWGVFSPAAFHAVEGSLAVNPVARVQLRGRAEWFRYDATETSTPTVGVEDRGWRWSVDGSFAPEPRWTLEAGAHGELAPGAASRGLDARVGWRPEERIELAIRGGSLARPLELRFQNAGVNWAGVSGDYRAGSRWRVGIAVDRYWESRDRPDAAAFDWNQWRISGRLSLTLRSDADRWVLPPARRNQP
jgi:hypothetical protein